MKKIKATAKAWAALVAALLTAAAGYLPEQVAPWVALGIAVCGAITTWAVPNVPETDD